MGAAIRCERFEQVDYDLFGQRLGRCLAALARLLERPEFGTGPATVGVELELFLVDRWGRPLPRNHAVRRAARDPLVGLELDRFNLELTTVPVALAGRPFSTLGQQLTNRLQLVARAVGSLGGRVAAVGILPTLRAEDLQAAALTDAPRYRALGRGMRQLRRQPIRLRIKGCQPLAVDSDELALAGAGTAYNAVQLATPVVLAAAGNSPTLLGHLLWEETRIPLMEQTAQDAAGAGHCRAGFGSGWVGRGALELLEQTVRQHPPLLPVLGAEDPLAAVRAGAVPLLEELRLHQGTVWDWNRAVYDPAAGGTATIGQTSHAGTPSVAVQAAVIAEPPSAVHDSPAAMVGYLDGCGRRPGRTPGGGVVRLVTVGVGAMDSPRYAPAGLLVAHRGMRVLLDGGPGAAPHGPLDAWLLTDERAELAGRIRSAARARGLAARVGSFGERELLIEPRPVVHTSHPIFGYELRTAGRRVVWAPEFWEFPSWARDADLMFAEAAGWQRPIRFAGGVGGHLDVLQVAAAARRLGVQRLVFAHIGRPTIRALDRGERPPFGEVARDGQVFRLTER